MGKTRAAQRFIKIKDRILKARNLFIAIFGALIVIIIGTIEDRYFGNPVVDAAEKYLLQNGYSIGLSLVKRIYAYPFETSLFIFFLTLSLIIIFVFFETRDPDKITVSGNIPHLTTGKTNGTWRDTGFVIINNSNNDLENCTTYIRSIDGENKDRKYEHDYLDWGEPSGTYYQPNKAINIPRTEKGYVYVNQMQSDILRSPLKNSDMHNVEILFHANTKTGETITIPIFCKIKAGSMAFNGFTTDRVLLEKVET